MRVSGSQLRVEIRAPGQQVLCGTPLAAGASMPERLRHFPRWRVAAQDRIKTVEHAQSSRVPGPCQLGRRALPGGGRHASNRSQRRYRAECRSNRRAPRYPLLRRSGPRPRRRLAMKVNTTSPIQAHETSSTSARMSSTMTPAAAANAEKIPMVIHMPSAETC